MSIEVVLGVSAVLLALSWIPVGLFFWRSWRTRRSPLSLAICALVAYPVFTNVSTFAFLAGPSTSSVGGMIVANTVLLFNFLLCFHLQKKFPDSRKHETLSPPVK